jgi:hypothetical protein
VVLTARNLDGRGVCAIVTGDKDKGDAEPFSSLDVCMNRVGTRSVSSYQVMLHCQDSCHFCYLLAFTISDAEIHLDTLYSSQ